MKVHACRKLAIIGKQVFLSRRFKVFAQYFPTLHQLLSTLKPAATVQQTEIYETNVRYSSYQNASVLIRKKMWATALTLP